MPRIPAISIYFLEKKRACRGICGAPAHPPQTARLQAKISAQAGLCRRASSGNPPPQQAGLSDSRCGLAARAYAAAAGRHARGIPAPAAGTLCPAGGTQAHGGPLQRAGRHAQTALDPAGAAALAGSAAPLNMPNRRCPPGMSAIRHCRLLPRCYINWPSAGLAGLIGSVYTGKETP